MRPGPQRAAGVVLRQTDGVSCGPSVLVATAALTGAGWPGAAAARFAAAQRTAHRQANRFWPRALGTTPWGMRAWLHRHAPAAGRVRVRPYRGGPHEATGTTGGTTAEIAAAVAAGRPVPLLVGSAWLPRHWVLVTGLDGGRDGRWLVYEPSSGEVRRLDPASLADRSATPVLGWPRAFCALVPAA